VKILQVGFWHPELLRGGAQQVCYELFCGLRARDDVEVTLLASVDESVPALYKAGARITGFDGRPGEYLFLSRAYDHWWHKVPEPLLVESFAEFLEMVQPDVVHFHHFLVYGIDMLTVARRVLPNARIILTLHEFLAICFANGQMLRKTDRSLCTHASPVRCHQCFPERAPEDFFVREMWIKRHLEAVDYFTTPSRFMIEHYVDWGLDRAKFRHITNGQQNRNANPPAIAPRARRNRFGFFGQMVDNKGVVVLLRAVQLLRAEGFADFTVDLNGDNLKYASEPNRKEVEAFLEEEQARPVDEQIVFFRGSYEHAHLPFRMAELDWCIVPSVWWEIFGLVISEAWMFGKPVIASNVGGMAERIEDGVNGLHFAVGDPRALARVMRRAVEEDGLWERLVAGITPPASREEMVALFMDLYREPASAEATPALEAAEA
jgi:glycosyltransferase involved in cell wall biosynthesis